MLVQAAGHLEAGNTDADYDLIMVDEFQDASRARARLVRGLVKTPGRFLIAVGDDWQSINRFAGADLSVMTDFESLVRPGTPAGVDDHLPVHADDLRCRPDLRVEEPGPVQQADAIRAPRSRCRPSRSFGPTTPPTRWPPTSTICPLLSQAAASRAAATARSASTFSGATGLSATSSPGTPVKPARYVPHRARVQGARGRLHRDSRHDHRHVRVPEHRSPTTPCSTWPCPHPNLSRAPRNAVFSTWR